MAEAVLDVRVTTGADQTKLEECLRVLAETFSTDGIHFELTGRINRPPKECNTVEEGAFAEWQRRRAAT